jgi:hypothetical protein
LRSEEEKVIASADSADRAAKYQLRKKMAQLNTYKSATKAQQDLQFAAEWEKIAAKRFDSRQSGRLSHCFITYLY